MNATLIHEGRVQGLRYDTKENEGSFRPFWYQYLFKKALLEPFAVIVFKTKSWTG